MAEPFLTSDAAEKEIPSTAVPKIVGAKITQNSNRLEAKITQDSNRFKGMCMKKYPVVKVSVSLPHVANHFSAFNAKKPPRYQNLKTVILDSSGPDYLGWL